MVWGMAAGTRKYRPDHSGAGQRSVSGPNSPTHWRTMPLQYADKINAARSGIARAAAATGRDEAAVSE